MILKNKKMLYFGISLIGLAAFSGCGKQELPTVHISVWTDERQQAVMEEALENFKELHKEEVQLEYSISLEREDTCKATVLSNPKGAADIYFFADDQLDELIDAGALLHITENVDQVIDSVGGYESAVTNVVMRDDKLYAYPFTAGNGYFLYYDKSYFQESDVEQLDRILKICEEQGKQFTMDYSSGWYLYSFFKGAGLTLEKNEEGTANLCNWNAKDTKIQGIAVAEAIQSIAAHPSFVSLGDQGFVDGMTSGEVIAGVNGPWNAENVKAALGENYAACKLPTYTVDGQQVQMCSFCGYKLAGVNAYTASPEWSMKVAEYLTGEKVQIKIFETSGQCPANTKAANNEKVKQAPAIAALAAQAPYGYRQSVGENFWSAASQFGITIASGNRDGVDLQTLLDDMQKEIVKPTE